MVERSLSKGVGLDKMAELVAMASGGMPSCCALLGRYVSGGLCEPAPA